MRIEARASHLPDAKPATPAQTAPSHVPGGNSSWEVLPPNHGLAVDLGTTTVVTRLYDLSTGELKAESAFENPQRFAGSDVMSRIQYNSEDRTHVLQRTLAGYLNHAVEEFPISATAITDVVIAGNSTMRDLFFRIDVTSIGQSPYRSLTEIETADGKRPSTSLLEKASRLGWHIHPDARVWGLPIISGHVGADTAACMLATNLATEDRLVAIMDIGTNTELVLGNRHKLMAASCPAGPAFEGGRISCGMPGLNGAIEKVRLTPAGTFELQVIGGGPAEGICGSGLVELLSELRRTGLMNRMGRFENGQDRIDLTPENEEPVYLSEADVNELAQAKAAHAAGLRILFENYGAAFDDLDVFYLAGGFGKHLNVEAAKQIGLIPNIDSQKIVQVGNASIEGASQALLSSDRRTEVEQLVRLVSHCRLETHPNFFDFFVEGCQFAPIEIATPGVTA